MGFIFAPQKMLEGCFWAKKTEKNRATKTAKKTRRSWAPIFAPKKMLEPRFFIRENNARKKARKKTFETPIVSQKCAQIARKISEKSAKNVRTPNCVTKVREKIAKKKKCSNPQLCHKSARKLREKSAKSAKNVRTPNCVRKVREKSAKKARKTFEPPIASEKCAKKARKMFEPPMLRRTPKKLRKISNPHRVCGGCLKKTQKSVSSCCGCCLARVCFILLLVLSGRSLFHLVAVAVWQGSVSSCCWCCQAGVCFILLPVLSGKGLFHFILLLVLSGRSMFHLVALFLSFFLFLSLGSSFWLCARSGARARSARAHRAHTRK